MNAARPAEILRQLEQSGAPDADLLARFVATKDAAAFAELVRRHGALVLGVCRRVTGHPQDAEDAFQATFLVLAQKAGAVRNAALLGNWLYGVAFRVAWRAKRSALRRRVREVPVSALPDPPAPPVPPASEVRPIIDEELAALPACYREALVLCDLQGASREEAAGVLGIPEGTLSSRLANGRKKLAARLTKRGVALSAAALPLAVAQAQAAVSVSNELVTRTCGLVADWAAGGAVPGSLARLTNGGFAVRKTFMLGAVMAVAVAGAVFAARPDDKAPPTDPAKPQKVADKAEAPPAKEEPKPAEKAVAFASSPKLRRSFDLAVGGAVTVMWNPTGTHLAVAGKEHFGDPVTKQSRLAVWVFGVAPDAVPVVGHPEEGARLVALAPDGKGLLTDLREHQFVSGHHHLKFWSVEKTPPIGKDFGGTGLKVAKTVELDLPETRGYAFAADGKTYRTVASHRGAAGEVESVEVLEVDAGTGKAVRALLKLEYSTHALCANGRRLAVLSKDATKVTVYDVDAGTKVSEYAFPPDAPVTMPGGKQTDLPRTADPPTLIFSPDGRRLAVTRGVGRFHLLNADTGAALPLDGTALVRVAPDARPFSGDGRLLASLCVSYYITPNGAQAGPKVATNWSTSGRVLTVWDTQTGKVLKTWKLSEQLAGVAFCPTKPLLAVLEPNGPDSTRVGFWDFVAEVEKK